MPYVGVMAIQEQPSVLSKQISSRIQVICKFNYYFRILTVNAWNCRIVYHWVLFLVKLYRMSLFWFFCDRFVNFTKIPCLRHFINLIIHWFGRCLMHINNFRKHNFTNTLHKEIFNGNLKYHKARKKNENNKSKLDDENKFVVWILS